MNLTEMERHQSNNVRPVIAHTMTVLAPYRSMPVSTTTWYQILHLLFEIVQPAARRSAEIARDYYDAKRAEQGLPPHLIPLAELTYERFVKDMEPVRASIQRDTTVDAQIHTAALRVARSIENSGRWTTMRAREYPDPGLDQYVQGLEVEEISLSQVRRERRAERGSSLVKGWARVATGAETCGFCWMLVSRGPVYESAATAGASVTDRDAMQMVAAGDFKPTDHMHQWHTGCDCKVVPVFRLDNWEGRDRYQAAEQLWAQVTKGHSGKDALNAYRRAVEAGGIQEILSQPLVSAA